MVIWALLLSAAIGALCGIWLHVVVFTLLSVIVAFVFLLSAFMSGLSLSTILIWVLMLSTALSAGYIASHLLRYVLHSRGQLAKRRHPELNAGSKYLHDQKQQ